MLLTLSTGICLILVILYYLLFAGQIKPTHSSQDDPERKGLSVLIAARNEVENLKKNIPAILSQDYDRFEVIVLNHNSKDETKEVLESFKDNRLRIIDLSKSSFPNKKSVIEEGIKMANYDHLVFTDADCLVTSNRWLAITNRHLSSHEVVLGYSPYKKQVGFLNKLIRYETLIIGASYLSFAKKGIPYMGVGRNMAYKKSLFVEGRGFESHLNILSGDDDLFIQEHATRENTTVCIQKDHFTYSEAKNKWIDYWVQKKRHMSTGIHYTPKVKVILGLFPISVILFWILLLSIIFIQENYYLASLFLIGKIGFHISALEKISKVLGEKDLLVIAPLLELITVIYNGFVAFSLLLSKNIEWK
ncbi:MAG: glycosyltransferase [Bacteroidota bacterium]